MSCEHGNWPPCEACDKEAALHARIEALEKECDAMRASVAWHRRRWMALQTHQKRMREPERTMVCDILVNGELLHPTVAGDRYAVKDAPSVPTIEAAEAIGAKGGLVVEAERLAFEAWVRGHNWSLCATWNGNSYLGEREQGGAVCPHAMRTRTMWAAWRDRAALAAEAKP